MVNYVIACHSLLLLIIFSVSEVNRVINENLYAHICILYMCRKCNHTLSWIYIKLLSHGTRLLFLCWGVCSVHVCFRLLLCAYKNKTLVSLREI